MATESEDGVSEEAKKFKAPDISGLVEDPDKAEAMAYAGKGLRDKAAELRREEGESYERHPKSVTKDSVADMAEDITGFNYDIDKLVENMDDQQLAAFAKKTQDDWTVAHQAAMDAAKRNTSSDNRTPESEKANNLLKIKDRIEEKMKERRGEGPRHSIKTTAGL